MEMYDSDYFSDLDGLYSQLENLGGLVKDAADRVKSVVERADQFVQWIGPKLGVSTSILLRDSSELTIRKWDKDVAENGDGKWHILFLLKDIGQPPSYCQPLPSAKLEYRVASVPELPNLLRQYLAEGHTHLSRIKEMEDVIGPLEKRIEERIAMEGLD